MSNTLWTVFLNILVIIRICGGQSIKNIIGSREDLTTFNDFLKKLELKKMLNTVKPHTVFAPNNDAFSSLPDDVFNLLNNDDFVLSQVISYHIVQDTFTSNQFFNNKELQSINDEIITIKTENGTQIQDVSGI